jgi:hypothetical protein
LSNVSSTGDSYRSGSPLLFNCPERKSLYYQLVKVINVLVMAQRAQMNVLIPHLIVSTGVGLQFVPFSEVFDPPPRIGNVHIGIATHYNLHFNKPNKIIQGNEDHECEDYFNIWGSNDIEFLSLDEAKARYEALSSEWIAASPGVLSEPLFLKYPQLDMKHLGRVLNINERTSMFISHVEEQLARVPHKICISTLGCLSHTCKENVDNILSSISKADTIAILLEYSTSSWLNTGESVGSFDILHKIKKWAPLMNHAAAAATATFIELYICLQAETIYLSRNTTLDYLLSVMPSNAHLNYM